MLQLVLKRNFQRVFTMAFSTSKFSHMQAAHIYQLLLEDASGLRLASAELVGAIIEDLGKQYMLSLQVSSLSQAIAMMESS